MCLLNQALSLCWTSSYKCVLHILKRKWRISWKWEFRVLQINRKLYSRRKFEFVQYLLIAPIRIIAGSIKRVKNFKQKLQSTHTYMYIRTHTYIWKLLTFICVKKWNIKIYIIIFCRICATTLILQYLYYKYIFFVT